MPYPKNKYRKGFIIFGWNSLMYEHLEVGRWVYLRGKAVHPRVILNMTIETVRGFLDARMLSEAIDQQKEYSARK